MQHVHRSKAIWIHRTGCIFSIGLLTYNVCFDRWKFKFTLILAWFKMLPETQDFVFCSYISNAPKLMYLSAKVFEGITSTLKSLWAHFKFSSRVNCYLIIWLLIDFHFLFQIVLWTLSSFVQTNNKLCIETDPRFELFIKWNYIKYGVSKRKDFYLMLIYFVVWYFKIVSPANNRTDNDFISRDLIQFMKKTNKQMLFCALNFVYRIFSIRKCLIFGTQHIHYRS